MLNKTYTNMKKTW